MLQTQLVVNLLIKDRDLPEETITIIIMAMVMVEIMKIEDLGNQENPEEIAPGSDMTTETAKGIHKTTVRVADHQGGTTTEITGTIETTTESHATTITAGTTLVVVLIDQHGASPGLRVANQTTLNAPPPYQKKRRSLSHQRLEPHNNLPQHVLPSPRRSQRLKRVAPTLLPHSNLMLMSEQYY